MSNVVLLELVLIVLILVLVLLVLVLLVLLLRNTDCVHIATSVIRSLWLQLWYTCTVSEVVYIAFRSGTIFMKSHKSAPLYLSRCQRYAGENDLGVILPPPLGHRRANRIFDYSNEKENNCMLFSISYE